MIDFNLELWQSGNYNVVTANGEKVLKLTYFEFENCTENDFCLAGLVGNQLHTWLKNGRLFSRENTNDLKLVYKTKGEY